MEEICCTEHGAPCMLKTGTKPGPNLGKCFYLCSVLRDKCDFVKEAENITSAACLKHPENIADLQHVTIGKVSGEKRHYYKCAQGVEKGQNWCGYVVMTSVGKVVPLGDSQKHNIEPRNVSTSVSVKKSVEDAESKMNQGSNFKNHNRHSGVPIPKLPKAVSKVADTSSGTQKERHEGKSSHGTTALDKDSQRDFTTSLAERIRNNSDSSPEIIEITSKASQGARPKMANFDFGSSVEEFSPPTYRSEIKVQSLARPPGNDAVIEKISRELKLKKQMMGTVNLSSLPDNGERLRQQVVDLENQLSNLNLQTSGSRSNTHSAPVPPPSPPPPPYNQGKKAPEIYTVYPSKPGSAPDHAKTIHVMHQQVTHKSQSVMKMDPPGVKTGQGMKQPVPPPPPPPPPPYNQGKNAPQVYTVYPTKPGSAPGEAKTIHVMHQQASHKSQSVMKMDPPGVKTGQGMKQPILSFKTAAGAPVGTAKQSIVLNSAEPLPDHILKQMYGAKPQMMTLYGGRMTADRLKEVGTVTRDAIEDLHKQLDRRPAETQEAEDPIGLNVSLMTHQRQALTWLMWREKQRPSGGILADDMGLGKTLTMISLIMKQFELNPSLKEVGKGGKGAKGGQDWMSKDKQLEKIDKNIVKSRATLVICPASLIHQWYKEIENRCEEGILRNVLLYHGPNREPNVFKLADNDVVLTTYNIVSKEVGEDADAKEAEKPVGDQEYFKGAKAKNMPNIARIAWERLILDEAHNIKNHKCKTAISVCRLRAGCRWALTGTPIQNDLIDMYSLLRFLRCSPFDEFQVWKRQVSMNVESGKARLNTLVKTFLLRRTKNQTGKGGKPLVPLPKKSVVVHDLKLSKDEKAVYDQVFAQSQSKFKEYLKRHTEKNGGKLEDVSISGNTGGSNPFMGRSSGGGKGASGGKDAKATGGTHILVSLLRLRQCCGHLSLLKSAIEDEVLETEGIELSLEEQMQGLMLSDSETKPKGRKSVGGKKSPDKFDISKASSKIKAVMEEIEKVQKKSTKGKPLKSVVVSQWTKMLEIAAHHFDKAGIQCSVIQGNIPPQKRMETVEEFNKDPNGPTVLLLSLRAGGVGLNLIGGSNLFLLDQHWNPALEEQACDRIYRVGQTNDVFIHRFLCTDTVEEKIAELQRRKTDLANDVLSGSSASKKKLTLADLRMLFGV